MVAAVFAAPTPARARASTVTFADNPDEVLHVAGDGDERNVIRVTFPAPAMARVTDVAPVHAGRGCEQDGDRAALCPLDASVHFDVETRVDAGAGDDTIFVPDATESLTHYDGGPGDDRLVGGAADDRLLGGAGDDVLFGGPGDDVLTGGPGADVLHGGADSDRATAVGADRVFGDGGSDVLVAAAADQQLFGGPGDDFLYVGAARVRGGPGVDGVYRAGVTPSHCRPSAHDHVVLATASVVAFGRQTRYGSEHLRACLRPDHRPVTFFGGTTDEARVRSAGTWLAYPGYQYVGGRSTDQQHYYVYVFDLQRRRGRIVDLPLGGDEGGSHVTALALGSDGVVLIALRIHGEERLILGGQTRRRRLATAPPGTFAGVAVQGRRARWTAAGVDHRVRFTVRHHLPKSR